MKNVLFGIMLIALLGSCSKSPEEKVAPLIKDTVTKALYHAESYDPVETEVDSAFAPFDDPIFFEKTLQYCKLSMAINKYDWKIKRAKSSMAIWGGPYQSEFDKNKFHEAKEEYEENTESKSKAEAKIKKLVKELDGELAKGPLFIGFKARHRYRAKNDAGETSLEDAKFLFDKDLSKVVMAYDINAEEYTAVQEVFKQMRGEPVVTEDDTWDVDEENQED